jgi:SUF system NifU family Fe-S assembly protein
MEDYLEQLYQDIILDHSKRPRHEHELEPCTGRAEGYNPICGDKVTVFVREEDGKIAATSFVGEGCAISRASASIMTTLLSGLTPDEAHAKALAHKDKFKIRQVLPVQEMHGVYSFYLEDLDHNWWEVQHYANGFQHDDFFDFGDRFTMEEEGDAANLEELKN